MRITIFFYCLHHFLETAESGSKNPVIVRVPEHAVVVVVDPTACGSASEEFEEIVYVETIENTAKDCALADTVTKSEDVGNNSVPANIRILK